MDESGKTGRPSIWKRATADCSRLILFAKNQKKTKKNREKEEATDGTVDLTNSPDAHWSPAGHVTTAGWGSSFRCQSGRRAPRPWATKIDVDVELVFCRRISLQGNDKKKTSTTTSTTTSTATTTTKRSLANVGSYRVFLGLFPVFRFSVGVADGMPPMSVQRVHSTIDNAVPLVAARMFIVAVQKEKETVRVFFSEVSGSNRGRHRTEKEAEKSAPAERGRARSVGISCCRISLAVGRE